MIFTVQNVISIIKIILLAPLAGYFFIKGENYYALSASTVFIFLDIIDGYIARKLNQVTNLGAWLDVIGDNLFLAILAFSFLYLGYVDWGIIALMAAHRFTRLFLTIYVKFYNNSYYLPAHIKLTGFIPMLYIFLIPFSVQYFGEKTTDIATLSIIGGTYAILLVSVIVAIPRLKKGKLKMAEMERLKIRRLF
jgi:cardiolipin synthase